MDWQIEVDEAMFLGGLPKGAFLEAPAPEGAHRQAAFRAIEAKRRA